MGRTRVLLTLVGLAGALGAALPAAAGADGAADAAGGARIVAEAHPSARVVELTIATPAFAQPVKVDVDLPTGYDDDPGRRWPVTYFTAGTMNHYNSFNSIGDGVRLTAGYPSLVVSPDGNSGYWSDWYNNGAGGTPQYETYVIDQLIPLIDAHFRTSADRAHRVIFGISMGGYGATMLAARHPDLFSAVASLSGADDSNNPLLATALSASSTFDGAAPDAIYGPRATQEIRWRGHNPVDLAANLRGLDVQVRTANGTLNPAIGEDATPVNLAACAVEAGVYQGSVSLHQTLQSLGIDHLWRDYGAGCHTPQNFKREIADTLTAFAQGLAAPAAAPATFSYKSIEPRFDVYGWSVAADPARALEWLELDGASAAGATLVGSGTTTVTTPALFAGDRTVDVLVAGAARRTVVPDAAGRVSFAVDLGPAHRDQENTVAAQLAGDGSAGYMTRRAVTFVPHARPGRPGAGGGAGGGGGGSGTPVAGRGSRPAVSVVARRRVRVGAARVATIGTVACGTAAACRVTVPKSIKIRIGGRTYVARVLAPRTAARGKRATIRLRLTAAARRALRGRAATAKVRVVVRAGSARTTRTLSVRLTA